MPRHVYEAQLVDNTEVTPPPGYRLAWKDDRLNPRRAQQNVRGRVQMDLVWTQEVPRRLIDANTNRDVTGKFPKLVYPYVDLKQQLRYRGTDSNIGQTTRRAVLRNRGVRASTKAVANQAAAATPRTATTRAAQKYVQVGTFGEIANADRTAARLKALGLPVRQAQVTRGGNRYRVVLAGPFNDQAKISAALRAARKAGFRDAFLRN
ncbi:MAG: SPOR domain-containing protein [Rhodobacterales bacterium]|nr:SPOR domain-containing protein [Rhodobacterales bacterium]